MDEKSFRLDETVKNEWGYPRIYIRIRRFFEFLPMEASDPRDLSSFFSKFQSQMRETAAFVSRAVYMGIFF